MQHQLPQFIEVEDKIFGPFTFKQFVYLVGGAGLSYLIFTGAKSYLGLPFIIAGVLPVPIIVLSLALAFYKINNRPFIFTLEAMIKYTFGHKLYLWKKEHSKTKQNTPDSKNTIGGLAVPTISNSKLKDLNSKINIQNPI